MIREELPYDERYIEYIELFNDRLYYDCHEVLEDLWLDEALAEDRQYYKALIQYAAALLLLFRRNHSGAAARFQSALIYLQPFPSTHYGLDLARIRENIRYWLEQLARNVSHTDYRDKDVPKLQLNTQFP